VELRGVLPENNQKNGFLDSGLLSDFDNKQGKKKMMRILGFFVLLMM
jgi:hypothetical protein